MPSYFVSGLKTGEKIADSQYSCHRFLNQQMLIEKFGKEFGAAEENEKPDQPFYKEKHKTGQAQFFHPIFKFRHGFFNALIS
jgi:hypothetical protein